MRPHLRAAQITCPICLRSGKQFTYFLVDKITFYMYTTHDAQNVGRLSAFGAAYPNGGKICISLFAVTGMPKEANSIPFTELFRLLFS